MTHHNTHGTLDSVGGKQERGYVFNKAVDDGNVSTYCYICGVWISVRQISSGEEI